MKQVLCSVALAAGLAASVSAADSTVVISEIMAVNNTTLADEDGTYSDWIELYNASTNAINLAGWYLANKQTDLTHWMFPATNLSPHQFLVVFASNKDRRIPGAPLHANFKLGGSGEYLALVMPDGVTKTSEFAPAFPQQYADISYGCVMTGAVTTLVSPTASARARVPTSDIGTNWWFVGYNDSAWTPGTQGVGYDVFGNYSSAIGLNLKSTMLNSNASAYVRVPFMLPDARPFKQLSLSMRYDDGFVAYLNGTEVLRRNAPATLAWNSSATAAHGAPDPGSLTERFEGSATNYTLSQYGNAPAPAVQNAGANSTGKFLRLLFDGKNGCANGVAFRQAAPGLFQNIVADFDFRVSSSVNSPADGFAFLLIPTSLYGTNGAGVNITSQAVEKPNYKGVFGVGFSVYPHTQVNDVSVHWDGIQATDVNIPTSAIDLAAGVFHHAKVTLQYVTGGARVTVTLTPNINGTPGTAFSPIANLFIGGMNPFDCRMQFGGRTGGVNLALDLDNCSVQFQSQPGPIAFEEFDISSYLYLLRPGQNMLAIQALNLSPGNSNCLVQAQLAGIDWAMGGPATYLYPPTPGQWNNSAGTSLVPPPVTFWPPAGTYISNSLSVTLSCESALASIRYTVDGSTPGPSSALYTNPIPVTSNLVLRAAAELQGVPGPVTAANYLLLDASVTNFTSNLPLVIIDTLGQSIPDGSKVGAYSVLIDTNSPSGRTSLSSPPDYIGRLGIGLHGSSSLGFPKQPFAIELRDEGDHDRRYPLLGHPDGSDWLLYPSYADKTLLNNVLTEEIFRSMGHYAVRCKYLELFLRTMPGKITAADYAGIYLLIERIRIDSNRVDIAKLSPADNTSPTITGGYLFAKDRVGTNDLVITTTSGQQLIVLDPKADAITQAQYDYLAGYLNSFEAALYGPDWRSPLTGYSTYISVDSFVDQHWIVEYPKNIDGYRLSNFMNKDRNKKLKMEPIWDWDLSWGNANYSDGGHTNGWCYTQMGDGDDIWLHKLRTDPDFYQKIIDRWGAQRLTVFNATNLLGRVDQITNLLWEAQAREFARWPRLGTYVWPNPDGANGGWDVDYVSPTTYAGIVEQFKRFVLGRYLWIEQQFVPAPTLVTNGALLSLGAPLGSIYYTLDGTDPRASGGGISASARRYGSTVLLTNNAGIFARAFYTNAWSPPIQGLYIAELPALRITEINYHPAAPPTNSGYQAKDFEFLEIQNTGTNVMNLAGVHLGGGIDFTFAPNEYVPVGSATSNSFDGGGTAYATSLLGQAPAPYLTNESLAGNLLCLLNSGTNTARNRLTFNQTAAGNYDRLTAEFDFRATTTGSGGASGAPTLADFDTAGTPYTLTRWGATAPAVMSADTGSAGSFLRLVPAASSEAGTIAFNRSATGAFNSVVANFDFRITPPAGMTPADGFGFALLSTAAYGTNGAGPSFSEEPGLTGSIGIGFDVYANASTAQEPNNNHISLYWNGVQVGSAATPSFSLSNGKFHRAQVLVWFYGANAYVTVRLTPDINGVPGATETVFANAVLPGAAPYQSRVAFGARTGGAWAAHDLDNVNVQYSANAAAAAGLSFLVLPASQFGAAGPGTTLAHFADWPLVTNALALDLAFNPSNCVNDLALYWNAAPAALAGIPASSVDLDAGVFHHVRLQLDQTGGGAFAAATLTPNVFGTAGPPINLFSNRFIPGVTLANSRVEFAARNGGMATRVDLENAFINYQSLAPMVLNPGESIVVVHTLAAFLSRYGTGIRIAGEFSGSLNDAGDHLTLRGSLGEPILDFNYDPAWYPITDGGGFSLVTVDPQAPTAAWGTAQNWRPSSQPGGSPAGTDPAPPRAVLTATVAADDGLQLTWPASSGNFSLFATEALNSPAQWVPVTNTPVLVGGQWVVNSGPPTNSARFYRLHSISTNAP